VAAAQRVAADRDRELAGKMDASADQVRACGPVCMCAALVLCMLWLRASAAHDLTSISCQAPQPHPSLPCLVSIPFLTCMPVDLPACLQASLAGKELEGARAEVQSIRQQQEAERARVKKAIAEMKRKMDGWVPAPPLLYPLCCALMYLFLALLPPCSAAALLCCCHSWFRSAAGSCSRTAG
jgi:hypothetical protein